ncbi:MAG TPA: PPOX class F420-dependent oxidoreductase [Humibacillus sp.]|nr:PPOX class F420-dependent oxidoreductase [Humibacillus sp.]
MDAPSPHAPADELEVVAAHRYVSLTTFRRSGAPVSTPVWIARDGDELVVVSIDDVGKTKRLAHTARVELRQCDMRGTVPEGAPAHHGTARVVRSAEEIAAVKRAIGEKYLFARLGDALRAVTSRVITDKPRAGIRITLE